MEWCKFCDNMLYIKHSIDKNDDSSSVMLYCKFCTHEEQFSIDDEAKLISRTVFDDDNCVNANLKHIEHDVSMPRVNATCINCKSQGDMILFLNDKINKRYSYHCPSCKSTWQPNSD